jgi:choline dehydrogenase-like flavoprotein
LRDLPVTVPSMIGFVKKRYFSKKRIPGFYLRNPNMIYGLYYHSEQWPNPDSRITLSHEADRLGLPKVRIGFRYHERDAESVLRTHDALAAWLLHARLGELRYRHAPAERAPAILKQAQHGPHQIGTTRMGCNAAEGVVDADLRTFGVRNLFVASCSVLPTSSQANPTLTGVALALRLAETLAARGRRAGNESVRWDQGAEG